MWCNQVLGRKLFNISKLHLSRFLIAFRKLVKMKHKKGMEKGMVKEREREECWWTIV